MSNRFATFRAAGRRGRRARPLSLEQLEGRQLLAADLQVRFDFVDQQQNSLSELQAGQVFFLDAYVKDIRPAAAGVFQAFIDVQYSNQASTSGPVTAGPAYNAFPTGDASVAGLINEAGGIDTDQVAPVPPDQELLLFRVPFQAGLAGTLQLTPTVADTATVMFDQVDAEDEIDFLNTSIEVVDSNPRVSVEHGSDGDEDGPVNGQFVVRQSLATQADTVVSYSVGGSAASGSDYAALSGSVTIPAGDTMALINVVVNDDLLVEDVEDVTIQLTGITAGAPDVSINSGQDSASLSIQDDDSALVSIVNDGDGDEEGPVAGAFQMQLSSASSNDTVVSYSLSGTATNGVDFTMLTGSVAIPAGDTTMAIPVAVVDDMQLEGLETVTVALDAVIAGDPQISIDSGASQATVEIADNDQAQASITASAAGDEAGPAAGQFGIQLSAASPTETQISYTLGGSATAGSDYTAPSGTVTIPAGMTMSLIDIPVLDDNLVEATETLVITLDSVLAGGQSVAIDAANDSATIQIADDDSAQVRIDAVTNGSEAGPVDGVLTVSQSNPSSTPTLVSYSIAGDATPGADYSALSGQVTIPAGETMVMISVPVLDDAETEGTETVSLTLTQIDSGHPQISLDPAGTQAAIEIADDEQEQIFIEAADNGNEQGPAPARLVVRQPTATGVDTIIDFTVSGSATAGDDYTMLSGTVTIPAGLTSADILVTVLDDDLIEGAETVVVQLDSIVQGSPDLELDPAASQASVEIADDESGAVTVIVDRDGEESGTLSGRFLIEQDGVTDVDTMIDYVISGSATSGDDFTPLSGTAVIAAGSTSVMLNVPVLDDMLVEGDETVTVMLADVVGSGLVFIDTSADDATLMILDDDSAEVRIEAVDGSEAGPQDGSFTVTQTAVSSHDTVVDYLIGGTASNGADFTVLSGSVVIPAGQQTATVQVTVVDDEVVEATETLVLTIDTVTNASQRVTADSAQDEATLEIADNDSAQISIERTEDGNETGPQSGLFRMHMTAPSSTDTVVAYSVAGSAESGSDFEPLSEMATIPAGTTSVDLPVMVLDDQLLEDLESVVVTLDSITSGDDDISIDGADDEAGLDIADNETGVIRIEVSANGGEQGPAAAQLTVHQDGATAEDTVIAYSVGGTATPGDDYDPLGGMLTIPAGSTSAVITATVSDDLIIEGDETIVVTLDSIDSGDSRLTLDPNGSMATAVIQDNDTALVSVMATSDAAESGPVAGVFTVAQGSLTAEDTVIAYEVNGSATSGADYQSLSGTVTIPAGELSATISVDALDDDVVEADETVQLRLQSIVSGASALEIDLDNDLASLQISDDDEAQISLMAAADGDEDGPQPARLTVVQSAASSTDTVVDILLSGTATEGQDYAAHSGQVTIPTGQTSVDLELAVLDDALVESTEIIVVSLDSVASGDPQISLSAQTSDSVEVADNDTATVSFASGSSTALELLGSHTVEVQLSVSGGGGITEPVTVSVQLLGGTADTPDDFTLDVTSVTFPAGSSDGQTMSVVLTLADDQVMEDDETILLGLQLEAGIGDQVSVGAVSEHEVTLTDDPMTGVVAGMVWIDANNNGLWNAGESPLPGVAVRLTGSDNGGRTVDILTFTDDAGQFRIENLPAGTYELHETQPELFYDGRDSLGSIGGAANGQAADDHFSQIVLGPGEQATGYNFGERGLKVEHLSAARFLTSMSVVEANRQMAALGQELDGHADMASVVRRHKTFEFRRVGSEATVIGGDANDVIEFTPAGADPSAAPDARADEHVVRVNGMLLALAAAEVDQFFLLAGEGTDRLILHDSAEDDTLTASGAELTLQSSNYRLDAISHELAVALSDSGGDDTASRTSLEFLLDLEGGWK